MFLTLDGRIYGRQDKWGGPPKVFTGRLKRFARPNRVLRSQTVCTLVIERLSLKQ